MKTISFGGRAARQQAGHIGLSGLRGQESRVIARRKESQACFLLPRTGIVYLQS